MAKRSVIQPGTRFIARTVTPKLLGRKQKGSLANAGAKSNGRLTEMSNIMGASMELVGAGKGSARRKGANDNAYADNYDRIFKRVKCPECGSNDVELTWMEATFAAPEWQHGECSNGHEWNESAR